MTYMNVRNKWIVDVTKNLYFLYLFKKNCCSKRGQIFVGSSMSLIQIILHPKKYPLAVPVKIEYIATNFLSIFATFDNELI